jgi:hypothetical protein
MFEKEPCLTCYAEDCLNRRAVGLPNRTKEEYAAINPAPYVCDTGGYSICESHFWPAMIAGWEPRRKDTLFEQNSTKDTGQ